MASEHVHAELALPSGSATGHIWRYGGPSEARPLLFVHGFRGDHHGLEFIAENIRRRQSFVPDLPGFGLTPPLPGAQTLESYTAFVRAAAGWVEQQTGLRPVLAGHSFGSILCAHAAARYSTSDDPLVLINPIVSLPKHGPGRLMTEVVDNYYRVSESAPKPVGDFLLKNRGIVRAMSEVMATSRDRSVRRFIHDQHRRHFSSFSDRKTLAEAYRVSTHHTVLEVADQLTMPVLVISGAADAIAPRRPTLDFVRRLPNVRHREFERVGHLVHYERPQETAEIIEDWLD